MNRKLITFATIIKHREKEAPRSLSLFWNFNLKIEP